MKRDLAFALALLLAPAQAPAQTHATQQPATPAVTPQPQPAQTPTPEPDSEEDVVRITSNLVQFDAVVTDGQGRHVADLRPEEFEVYVDGKRQELTNFTFVAGSPATAAERPAARDERAVPPPPLPNVQPRAGQVRRTIALVADDLGTSFADLVYVKRALKKFVDEQMQAGDLVAVMRTSAGIGALQQFTNDKQLLYRAIERVRWSPVGRAGATAFPTLDYQPPGLTAAKETVKSESPERRRERESMGEPEALEEFREGVFTVGTLGALDFIVRGMGELPGRKSVVVFSGGFQIYKDPNKPEDWRGSDRVIESLRRLTDKANRASVVIYTMDARGLVYTGLTAADTTTPRPAPRPTPTGS